MPLRILVIGSGAREHALLWKLAQSDQPVVLYAAPGNAGTAMLAQNVGFNVLDVSGLVEFARREKIDLTIVGPDLTLAAGIVDAFQTKRLRIFGPTKIAATIETSKSTAKFLMKKFKIPTAKHWLSIHPDHARAMCVKLNRPLVLKANGLAQGKGVYRCRNLFQALAAIDKLLVKKNFGEAGDRIIIEDWLNGYELSMHAICSFGHAILFPLSQDYKRLSADERSPNTGGMGAVAPIPEMMPNQARELAFSFIRPMLEGLAKIERPFMGCLYPGLMITDDGPRALEYNARFGDPEAQVYMRLLESDLLPMINGAVDNTLGGVKPLWSAECSVAVVLVTAGYPDQSISGDVITGLAEAQTVPGVVIFHAGTTVAGHRLLTTGGRTLSVTATGATMAEAVDRCYEAIAHIHFRGMYYRDDIGQTWLQFKT